MATAYPVRAPYVNKSMIGEPWDRIRSRGAVWPLNYNAAEAAIRRELHQSTWRAYGMCQRRYRFEYIDNLVPKGSAMPLMQGSLQHRLVTEIATGVLDWTKLRVEANAWRDRFVAMRRSLRAQDIRVPWSEEDIDAETELAVSMTERWAALPMSFKPVAAGLSFRLPIRVPGLKRRDPTWDFGGEWDMLIEAEGMLWVWEYKTTSLSDPDGYEAMTEHDPQSWGYVAAASELFGRDVGIVYDVNRKKLPTKPKFTVCKKKACGDLRKDMEFPIGKPGCEECGGTGIIGISKAAIDTTLAVVDDALAGLAKSPAGRASIQAGEYQDLIENAKRTQGSYAYRFWKRPTREYVKSFWKDVYMAAKDIERKERELRRGRDTFTPMRGQCRTFMGSCRYTSICPAFGSEPFDNFETREASRARVDALVGSASIPVTDDFDEIPF